jgi:hypothetical protein
MQRVLLFAVGCVFAVMVCAAQSATQAGKKAPTVVKQTTATKQTPTKQASAKPAPASKSAPKQSTAVASPGKSTSAHTPAKTNSASARKAPLKAPPARTTWRPRQTQPTPERYHEIQDALVAKGYLKPEQANGAWDQNSIDAMKRFQAEQKLDASGKITSMSLIALGLGPKHDATPPPPPAPGGPQFQ